MLRDTCYFIILVCMNLLQTGSQQIFVCFEPSLWLIEPPLRDASTTSRWIGVVEPPPTAILIMAWPPLKLTPTATWIGEPPPNQMRVSKPPLITGRGGSANPKATNEWSGVDRPLTYCQGWSSYLKSNHKNEKHLVGYQRLLLDLGKKTNCFSKNMFVLVQ